MIMVLRPIFFQTNFAMKYWIWYNKDSLQFYCISNKDKILCADVHV